MESRRVPERRPPERHPPERQQPERQPPERHPPERQPPGRPQPERQPPGRPQPERHPPERQAPGRQPPERRPARLLPPIMIDAQDRRHAVPRPGSPNVVIPHYRPWTFYHRGCIGATATYAPVEGADQEMRGNNDDGNNPGEIQPEASGSGLDPRTVTKFLRDNKDFLANYVVDSVSLSDIEKWLFKKLSVTYTETSRPEKRKHSSEAQPSKPSNQQIIMDLVKLLRDQPNVHVILLELARSVGEAVGADAFRVYKVFPDQPTFVQCFIDDTTGGDGKHLVRVDAENVRTVIEAAERGTPWRLSRGEDPVFPPTPRELLQSFGIKTMNEANHILYQPILDGNGKTAYVIELWHVTNRFKASDEEICENFVVWGSIALHFSSMYLDKTREVNMSDFLFDVAKSIFEELESLNQLMKRILEFAQRLVNADRASIFLVDLQNEELVSSVFDMKIEGENVKDEHRKEIRLPLNSGIAGHVALSGETLNIPDAYADHRFNRQIDEDTGYKTDNILCMPIKGQGKVIGVVQMVNKRNNDIFNHDDEAAFNVFANFFGLALHHAKLYDTILRSEHKYKVALDMLSYHNSCSQNEVEAMLADKNALPPGLDSFYMDPIKFSDYEKCKAVVMMFNDLFDIKKFDKETVTRFILTVKKNYRTVAYHNFDHAWAVAQSMYVILKHDHKHRFNYKVRLAMFVSSLCHDLDHRGYTNQYMHEIGSPLASMYSTSTLEHHHYDIAVTLLQQPGHNIFSAMPAADSKDILAFMNKCILSTDLARFIPNLKRMRKLLTVGDPMKFCWAVTSHRDLAMAITMTAADLSASTKPWNIQKNTVRVIFEEFYDQGDKEKAAGRQPLPMMDRTKRDEQPSSQVGFLSQICVPCYGTLYKLLPNIKPMYLMAMKNLNIWKSKAEYIANMKKNNESYSELDLTVTSEEDVSAEEMVIEQMFDESEGNVCDGAACSGHDENLHDMNIDSFDGEAHGSKSGVKVDGNSSMDVDGVPCVDDEEVVVKTKGNVGDANKKQKK